MPTELEELVEFLHHGNNTIRGTAVEHLVGFSTAQPSVFKINQLTPIKDLKQLIRDLPPIAKNALTILINLSVDPEILQNLASDDQFIDSLLIRLTDPKNTTATELCMLLANLSKHPTLQRVLTLSVPSRPSLSPSKLAIDHLLSAFLLGESGKYNPTTTYDYLAYVFAELAKFPEGRKHFVTPRDDDDGHVPLSKVLVFTEHASEIRRRGVAATIKNVCFEVGVHKILLSKSEINVLPFILLPLMGSEEYPDDEADKMPEELQLLPPDKEREKTVGIISTHLESLLLLSTTRDGREYMRAVKVYPIIRECHIAVEDEDVREACERLVDVLARDEPEGEDEHSKDGILQVEDDEDEQIIDIF